ncbi:hypothetical protein [Marinomonas algicola]|uniref:hypothetical protein n=1 Tax=Marinomonas algicola TaxID=2773454 RepID=UPI00174C7E2C|nr:hypothetical protein [Marinomonas algicola]
MSFQMQYDQWRFTVFGGRFPQYNRLNELNDELTGEFKKALIDELASVQKKALLFSQSSLVFEQKVACFEALDAQFDSLESMLFLLTIQYPNEDFRECQAYLNDTETLLFKSVSQFMTKLLMASSNMLPLWGKRLQEEHSTPPQNNASGDDGLGLITADSGFIEQLQHRIKSDPIEQNGYPKSFNQVCINNGRFIKEKVLKSDVTTNLHLTQSDDVFRRSRSYFSVIMSASVQSKTLSLQGLRAIQRQPWRDFYISIIEAIQFIERQFSKYDERFQGKVMNAFLAGRIRFVEDVAAASFCFDTPNGSFIQVTFVGDLESLALLAHECGHLIHQELIRDKWVLRQDIQTCLTESIAMYFENRIVKDRLLEEAYDAAVFQAWLLRQYNEWVNRHELFERFELGLYKLDRVNQTQVAHLWRTLIRDYYPCNIVFDPMFEYEGFKTPHLSFSPFYHSVYPIAYLYAIDINEKRLKKLITLLSLHI